MLSITQDYENIFELKPFKTYNRLYFYCTDSSILSSSGPGSTNYGFDGEQYDSYINLLNLRARQLNIETGRFLSRDIWPGNYTRPGSLNRWNFVESNPINYVDPAGYWRWYLTSSPYHFLIEQYYEGLPTNPLKQLEFPIPGTPYRHPDMFNSLLGDIYEIEPWYLQSTAPIQVNGYITDLISASGSGELSGSYIGVPYNWNFTPYHVGTGIDWPGKLRMPMPNFPMVDFVADFIGNGTVIYWFEPNPLVVTLPLLVPNKKLVRPRNWIPGQLAPQPAYVISLDEACGYGLIAIGGTIITVTVAEDFATAGAGIFDDVVTVPAGLLFINIGQRLAVFVPTLTP
jgi:RHS repeat-associated protein